MLQGRGQPSRGSLPCPAGSGEGREQAGDAEKSESFLLINFIGKPPAVLRVGVSMACVDEAVFKRLADVVGGQPCHRGHRVSGELAHF